MDECEKRERGKRCRALAVATVLTGRWRACAKHAAAATPGLVYLTERERRTLAALLDGKLVRRERTEIAATLASARAALERKEDRAA